MSIVPLPLPAHAEARALLHHLLEQGDVVGRDAVGRTILQLAVDDHTLDTLLSFDANDLEDQGDEEPDADDGRLSHGTQSDHTAKMHGKIVQSVPLDQQDIEYLIDGLRRVTPCTPCIDRLVDLLQQIRDRD